METQSTSGKPSSVETRWRIMCAMHDILLFFFLFSRSLRSSRVPAVKLPPVILITHPRLSGVEIILSAKRFVKRKCPT